MLNLVSTRPIRSKLAQAVLVIATATAVSIYYIGGLSYLAGPYPSSNVTLMLLYILSIVYCGTHATIYLTRCKSAAEISESLFRRSHKPENQLKDVVFGICGTASLIVISSFWTDLLSILHQGISWSDHASIINKVFAAEWTVFCVLVCLLPLFTAWVIAITNWKFMWDLSRATNKVEEMGEIEESTKSRTYSNERTRSHG